MAAFRAADQPRVAKIAEHLVDPRARGVDDEPRARSAALTAGGPPLDARRTPGLDDDSRHARVGFHDGAVRGRVEHVLDDEPLGIASLRVEVARAAAEPGGIQSRQLLEQCGAAEQRVARQ